MPADPLGDLVTEASRQFTICNACRYCEALCAVFPAMERRRLFGDGDVSHLANLCHDCRACLDACMYAPPHDFGVNLPRLLAAVRTENYRRYPRPPRLPSLLPHWLRDRVGCWLGGWLGPAAGIPAVALVLVLIAVAHAGPAGLAAAPRGAASPYALLPYPVLLAVVGVPAIFSITVMTAAARRYWADTGGTVSRVRAGAIWRAVIDSVTLRYLRGGGADCPYPVGDQPSPARRRLHGLVAGGFGLCVVSTLSAAVMQDLLAAPPPYPLLSAPVVAGTLGGTGIAVGCAGLLWMKPSASAAATDPPMAGKDYALLTSLLILAISGLATLAARTTAAYGPVLLVHLVAVAFTFIAAPYSKFPHFIYRFLALVRDGLEAGAA